MERDDDRLKLLILRIQNGTATEAEKKEYIQLLIQDGDITPSEGQKYQKELSKKETTEALLGIGAALLIGWLIAELFNKKD